MVEAARQEKQRLREHNACAALQAMWRRDKAFAEFQIIVYEHRREVAATKIQCAWHCCVARYTRAVLAKAKRRRDAAVAIQMAYRNHCARVLVADLRRRALENASARLIQRVYRGSGGRKAAVIRREEVRVGKIMTAFQSRVRAIMAANRYNSLQEVARAHFRQMVIHATRMQALRAPARAYRFVSEG